MQDDQLYKSGRSRGYQDGSAQQESLYRLDANDRPQRLGPDGWEADPGASYEYVVGYTTGHRLGRQMHRLRGQKKVRVTLTEAEFEALVTGLVILQFKVDAKSELGEAAESLFRKLERTAAIADRKVA